MPIKYESGSAILLHALTANVGREESSVYHPSLKVSTKGGNHHVTRHTEQFTATVSTIVANIATTMATTIATTTVFTVSATITTVSTIATADAPATTVSEDTQAVAPCYENWLWCYCCHCCTPYYYRHCYQWWEQGKHTHNEYASHTTC